MQHERPDEDRAEGHRCGHYNHHNRGSCVWPLELAMVGLAPLALGPLLPPRSLRWFVLVVRRQEGEGAIEKEAYHEEALASRVAADGGHRACSCEFCAVANGGPASVPGTCDDGHRDAGDHLRARGGDAQLRDAACACADDAGSSDGAAHHDTGASSGDDDGAARHDAGGARDGDGAADHNAAGTGDDDGAACAAGGQPLRCA
mmetsp:Transcript_61507/g.171933  ORF Transcript_61507/g.171933 Transcript_61507/m.171933 type:complete len:203 (+) Transcript_61507:381-989(+)